MAEKEYIEREAIQKRINRIVEVNNLRTDLAWFTPYGVKALIEEIPAADVRPVVRCKDCKHSDTFLPNCTEATFPLKCLSIRYGGVYPDWFCEHGEMKGGS